MAKETTTVPVKCWLSNGINYMVYTLYDLTPEEIAIVEGR